VIERQRQRGSERETEIERDRDRQREECEDSKMIEEVRTIQEKGFQFAPSSNEIFHNELRGVINFIVRKVKSGLKNDQRE
jgi:hypothetical protein